MPPDGETRDAADIQRENAELKAALEASRRQLFEEQARAETLDAQVSQTSARAASAQVAQLASEETRATEALTSIETEIRGLKQQWANLQAEGKFDQAADIQEQLGDATARRRQAMQAKEYYAAQKTAAQAQPTDPVEQFILANQGSLSSEDINWIRQNPRYAKEQNFRQRVISAHADAVGKGIRQRSPEYYKHLEAAGYMRDETPTPAPETEQNQQEGAPAPTGHTGGSATSDTGQQADEGEGDGPEIIIRERPAMAQNTQDDGPAFGRAPERPQPRAAGAGSMRAAIAASPSRSPMGRGTGRRTILELTPGERDSALAMAPHMAGEEVLKGGEAAVLQWYNDLKNSPASERIRQGWLERRGS
jgi:hypothetical protein